MQMGSIGFPRNVGKKLPFYAAKTSPKKELSMYVLFHFAFISVAERFLYICLLGLLVAVTGGS
jgi:hypothetical protein